MISIVISTHRNEYFVNLEKNISETIGVNFEIIKIDNPGSMGICEAYNCGARKANFDILCFVHEDVQFKTHNWGNKVLELFENEKELGLLGVAGCLYKSITPSHWSFPTANKNSFFVNVIQGQHSTSFYSNPKNIRFQPVAAIDGVWFCTRKRILQEFPFDELTCSGFHGYDVDYSLTIQQKYTVGVTFDVLIHHLSTGNFSKDWINQTIKVHKKWRLKLPLLIENFNGFKQQEEEEKALICFSKMMVDRNYSLFQALKIYQFQNERFRYSLKTILNCLYQTVRYKYFMKR